MKIFICLDVKHLYNKLMEEYKKIIQTVYNYLKNIVCCINR